MMADVERKSKLPLQLDDLDSALEIERSRSSLEGAAANSTSGPESSETYLSGKLSWSVR